MKTRMNKLNSVIMILSVVLVSFVFPYGAYADWSMPLSISASGIRTSLTLGIGSQCTNFYEPVCDAPLPFEGETLNSYFPHQDWNVTVAGGVVEKFYKDLRGTLPQDFYFEIASTKSPVTISWRQASLPAQTALMLYDHAADRWTDMSTVLNYSYNATAAASGFTIRAAHGDMTPPLSPAGINVEAGKDSMFIKWGKDSERDLAGYKLYYGIESGVYGRSIDLKDVNNYTLNGLTSGGVYYITLTAYDTAGNESAGSPEQKVQLLVQTHSLTVNTNGDGTVTPGSGAYDYGRVLTLTATPSTGYVFTDWSGCDSTSANTCTVAMTSDRSVTANFALSNKYSLTVSTIGSGTLTQPSGMYDKGTSVSINAIASKGYSFTGWSGCDSTRGTICKVLMTANRTVTATFTINKYSLTILKSGSGTVTPESGRYDHGTVIELTATPSAGSVFTRWTGCDSTSGEVCTVTMDRARRVNAAFTACRYSLNPGKVTKGKTGGTGKVTVTGTGGCGWTATSNADWITITAGESGSGSGTVSYLVSENRTNATRTGTITIAGKTFTMTQSRY